MPESFKYHSEETRSVSVNGEGRTRKNIVEVNGNSGTKRVEQWSSNGTKIGESEHELTADEIANIQARKFMPGLFDLPNSILMGGGKRKRQRSTKKALRRKTNRRS
jgi:hypothetical protein